MVSCLLGLVVGKLVELVATSVWFVDKMTALAQESDWFESKLAWIGDLSTLLACVSLFWLLAHSSVGLAHISVLQKSTELIGDPGLLAPKSTEVEVGGEFSSRETFLDLPLTLARLTVKSAIWRPGIGESFSGISKSLKSSLLASKNVVLTKSGFRGLFQWKAGFFVISYTYIVCIFLSILHGKYDNKYSK